MVDIWLEAIHEFRHENITVLDDDKSHCDLTRHIAHERITWTIKGMEFLYDFLKKKRLLKKIKKKKLRRKKKNVRRIR